VDQFPGIDPLYECLSKALDYIESEPERHIKAESDADDTKIAPLMEIIQQKDLIIQSKDELLKINEETLRASKALMADKDKIIKVRATELPTCLKEILQDYCRSRKMAPCDLLRLTICRSKRERSKKQPD
jgi:hypothetical protein